MKRSPGNTGTISTRSLRRFSARMRATIAPRFRFHQSGSSIGGRARSTPNRSGPTSGCTGRPRVKSGERPPVSRRRWVEDEIRTPLIRTLSRCHRRPRSERSRARNDDDERRTPRNEGRQRGCGKTPDTEQLIRILSRGYRVHEPNDTREHGDHEEQRERRTPPNKTPNGRSTGPAPLDA